MAKRWSGLALAAGLVGLAALARAETPEFLPTGQFVTPTAAPGAIFQPLNPHLRGAEGYTAGQAAAMALSPDGKTLLILTSGYNLVFGDAGTPIPALSQEYVFVFDVSGRKPRQGQVIGVPNTFQGIAWAPAGDRFFVSGGVDDVVYAYHRKGAGGFELTQSFILGHAAGLGLAV